MTILEALEQRHSVRQFKDTPIGEEVCSALNSEIGAVNTESGLYVRLFTDEPEAFLAGEPHYGQFSGCRNYLAIYGTPGRAEDVGYYGQRLVLRAQQLGLNSCWVALTYRKGKVARRAENGKKLYIVIALGYGQTQGTAHRGKTAQEVSDLKEDDPEWYKDGIRAALMAPTAINQQKFRFRRDGNRVSLKAGLGFYAGMDLGIVKYNFEIGAGKDSFVWSE
ncbi:MAG: nitroreductase [Clostridia bacterium]|nr:nitroreductase [Clostridia bacterium]